MTVARSRAQLRNVLAVTAITVFLLFISQWWSGLDTPDSEFYASLAIFQISKIADRDKVNSDSTRTTIFQGMGIRILNSAMADRLNRELGTDVFSDSVQVAEGSLVVTRTR